VRRHRPNKVVSEGAAHCRGTNGCCWLQFLTDLLQAANVLVIFGVELLLVGDTAALAVLEKPTNQPTARFTAAIQDKIISGMCIF